VGWVSTAWKRSRRPGRRGRGRSTTRCGNHGPLVFPERFGKGVAAHRDLRSSLPTSMATAIRHPGSSEPVEGSMRGAPATATRDRGCPQLSGKAPAWPCPAAGKVTSPGRSVRDNGQGVSERDPRPPIDVLRDKPKPTGNGPGLGLGFGSQDSFNNHGRAIEVRERARTSTTFRVMLTFAVVSRARADEQAASTI